MLDTNAGCTMQVLFLGTAAGERIPAPYCHSSSSRRRFIDQRLLKEDANFMALHVSPNGNPRDQDSVRYFGPYGVTVAYGGLQLML